MISEEIASEQLMRLSQLDFFPDTRTPHGRIQFKELRNALQAAATDAVAKTIVDDWILRSPECPKPVDLRLACNTENDRGKESPAVVEFDSWKALDRVSRGRIDQVADEHLHFLKLRVEELKNPEISRWLKRLDGSVYRVDTDCTRKLAEVRKRMARA